MHTTPRPRLRRSRALHVLPALVAVAALGLAACGSDDDASPNTAPAPNTVAPDDQATGDTTPGTAPGEEIAGDPSVAGAQPAGSNLTACDLLAPLSVDALLGTSDTTATQDTSLGLVDGCRFASAATDVPAVVLGYAPSMSFEDVRSRACDGAEPVAVPSAAPEAVSCFGALVAPIGGGALLVSIDDPSGQFDAATQDGLAAAATSAALLALAAS